MILRQNITWGDHKVNNLKIDILAFATKYNMNNQFKKMFLHGFILTLNNQSWAKGKFKSSFCLHLFPIP